MSTYNIPVTSREGVRIKTAGKYNDKDIIVTPEVDKIIKLQDDKKIIGEGTYTPDPGYDGLRKVTVAFIGEASTLQEKIAVPTKESQAVLPDEDCDALSKVTIEPIPEEYIIPDGTKSIVANEKGVDVAAYKYVDVEVPNDIQLGDVIVKSTTEEQQIVPTGDIGGFSKVIVQPIVLETNREFTENGEYEIPEGKDGYGSFKINVIQEVAADPVINNPDPITPTKEEQSIQSAEGEYFTNVTVEAIPNEYIIPTGTLTIEENNTTMNVAQYEYVDIIIPTPAGWIKTESNNGDGVAVDFAFFEREEDEVNVNSTTSTEDMEAFAIEKNVGSVITYTGDTNEKFEKNRMYMVEVNYEY